MGLRRLLVLGVWGFLGLRAEASERITLPFELIDNRIFVKVQLNGKGPFWVLFDTGGQNIVTPEVASALGLALKDPFQIGGAGEKTVQAWHTQISTMDLGQLHLKDEAFLSLPLKDIQRAIGFRHFDGIIGQELLERFTVRIDFSRKKISLESSETSVSEPGTLVPLSFEQGAPAIEGEMDGLKARFALDTGDRSSLTLCAPFVEKNKLIERYRPKFKTITGWGVGGPLPAQLLRVEKLAFSGFEVKSVVTRIPDLKGGAYKNPDVAGYVGNGVLKRFDIAFDFRNRRMILRPNAGFPLEDPYDRAGLWLSALDSGLLGVLAVIPGAPADQAGIHEGDSVIEVDGIHSQDVFLPTLRESLSRKAKPSARMAVQTGTEAARSVNLTLRDLL